MGTSDGARRWAASGALALTGDPGGEVLVAPDALIGRIVALGEPFGVDALALLGERAAIAGLSRRGSTSCGGAAQLLPAADAWVAVNLPRADDIELVPAWLEIEPRTAADESAPWDAVARAVAERPAGEVVERGRLLGLAVARLGERAPGPPVVMGVVGQAAPCVDQPLVVDLSSLWAGPLCAHLLGLAGARVVKVESVARPDGARRGPPAFFDLLHAGHRSVALDLRTPAGVAALRGLVLAADVVIEGSRPRALEQLGLVAADIVRDGPQVWASITGHGRDDAHRDAVAFGDDAAVAGDLVAWGADGRPRFVADAVADPLTGLVAAAAVLDRLREGGRWLLDVSLAGVAAFVAAGSSGGAGAGAAGGGSFPVTGNADGRTFAGAGLAEEAPAVDEATVASLGVSVASSDPTAGWRAVPAADAVPPRARRPAGRAAPLGADTEAVLRELGIGT